ncbi:hypothetical protein L2E82_14521 [Cichorium intybus]|uniref:Uncharacterized protein n=1 Tax=Cichorium intybus TaxID=13427 RepID=A0ACB9F0A1_CICIN|nr:hypothetical protein L2E82_14521 [Cichorium intybus]
MEAGLTESDLQTCVFSYRQIKAATDNFADSNKLGEGGFGSVYKGTLLDGTIVAVKQLSSKSKQGNREFVNEIGMIAALQHPNIAVDLKQKGSLIDLVDPRLGSEFNKKEAVRMIEIALLCTNESPALRPIMSEVVNILEGHNKIEELNLNKITSEDEASFQTFGAKFERTQSHDFDQTSISINPASSSSNDFDLYPDSQISQTCRLMLT